MWAIFKNMNTSFAKERASKGILEFRVEGDEIVIQGTEEGLRWLAQKCLVLVDRGKRNHIHLEEFQVLTETSKRATLILFPTKDRPE